MAYCNGEGFCAKRYQVTKKQPACDAAGECVKGFALRPHVRDEIDNAKNYPAEGEKFPVFGTPGGACMASMAGGTFCIPLRGPPGECKTRVMWLTGNSPKAGEIRKLNRGHPDLPSWEAELAQRARMVDAAEKATFCSCHPADAAEFDDGCPGGGSFEECCRIANERNKLRQATGPSDLVIICTGSAVIFLLGASAGGLLISMFF